MDMIEYNTDRLRTQRDAITVRISEDIRAHLDSLRIIPHARFTNVYSESKLASKLS